MAKRLFTVLALMSFMGGIVLLSPSGAQDQQKVPDEIILNSSLWTKHTYNLTKLSHKKHQDDYKIECTECHHVYKDKKNTWKKGDKVQKCQECHNELTIKGEKKLPEAQQKLNLKLAFHVNCIDCHKKMKKKDRKKYAKIPTSCMKCHPGGKMK
jgi:nitrate/TMAO reductase-like tetraheme cytochrome c subunit